MHAIEAGAGTWWRRPPVVDAGVAMVVAVVLIVQIGVATDPDVRPADTLAYALVAAVWVLLLVRRRWPGQVLIASVAVVLLYHVLGYPAIGFALPLAVPLFTAARAGLTVTAAGVVVVAVAITLLWMLLGASQPPLQVLNTVVREGAIMVAVVLAGTAYRGRRLLAEASRERMRLARAEEAANAERRMAAERMRIAHELHDVIAHTVALIGVQARVAGEALDDSPDDTRRAVEVISRATREATAELRATIAVLRAGDDHPGEPSPRHPLPGLAQVDALVASVRAGGLEVDVRVEGTPQPLPPATELTAYRVIQEALTNVVRHARATRATVRMDHRADGLRVAVRDDGVGARAAGDHAGAPAGHGGAASGHGITGMRERVLAAGGDLRAGAVDGGFEVVAHLPVRRQR